ncbi:DUF3344 domain-containing protein [Methanofollis sp. W23]|uniref:DUF3344 domain-containing protein n=1 Tax=Methanofollis sp. W23 TaxID=2817849 RepID=UPI001AE2549D|nr:DUF3344 domain-containing protein [Methanofollis sp. W23]
MKRKERFGVLFCILALLLLPAAAADSYVGGIPLSTEEQGTVSGGVYIDAYPGFATSAEKTFSLPAGAEVKWARLYVAVYCGNQQENYAGTVTVSVDGGPRYTDDLNVEYVFPGDDGDGPVWVNDHCTRVTSDYLAWYDVTSCIRDDGLKVKVATEKIDAKFDGRIKCVALVAAYDDGDGDMVHYWINQGHDTDSYKTDENGKPYVGETEFGTGVLETEGDEATLSVLYLASENGIYRFGGETLDGDGSEGAYFGSERWDVLDLLEPGRDVALTYDRKDSETFYKIFLSTLTVRYAERDVGAIAVNSVPAGALVYIDDEEQEEETNTTVSGLETGTHTVRVEMEGYPVPEEREVEVEKGETATLTFVLERPSGSISVSSEPVGAAVYLDGEETGVTTDTLLEEVPAGGHTIILKRAGYDDYTEEVVVVEGETAEVAATLTASSSSPGGGGGSDDGGDDGADDEGTGYAGGQFGVVARGAVAGNLSLTTAGAYTGLLAPGDSATFTVPLDPSADARLTWGRLYLFTTWGHDEEQRAGQQAEAAVSVDGTPVPIDRRYSDQKGEGAYDYPVETLAYNVTPYLDDHDLAVAVTNTGKEGATFALYGCALLTLSEEPGAPLREYWVAEGADALRADEGAGITSEEASTTARFTGIPSPETVSAAHMIVASTAATGMEGEEHVVIFNGAEWENPLQGGSSVVSTATFDVRPYLEEGESSAAIRSVDTGKKGDYMENRVVALVLTRGAPSSSATPAPGSTPSSVGGMSELDSPPTSTDADRTAVDEEEENPFLSWLFSLWSAFLSLLGFQVEDQAPDPEARTVEEKEAPVPTISVAPLTPQDAMLALTSTPSSALISLDGEYIGRTTPCTLGPLTSGRHTIRLDHEGCPAFESVFDLAGEQTLSVDLEAGTPVLSEELTDTERDGTGCILVDSKPDGVKIVFDGRTLPVKTPYLICGVKPGLHTVKVKGKRGQFEVDKKKCSVEPGVVTPLLFTAEKTASHTLNVRSEHFEGVEVSVDGRRCNAKIPGKVEVQGSSSYLSLRDDQGYFTFQILRCLDDGADLWIESSEQPGAGVMVESDPSGADILVDGFVTGYATPYLVTNLSKGSHLIGVSRPGYLPQEKRIPLVDRQSTPADAAVSFQLEGYSCGALQVTTPQEGARIYLHGKNTGEKTPYIFEYMKIGTYEVKVKDGNTAREQDVTVLPGRTVLCSFVDGAE